MSDLVSRPAQTNVQHESDYPSHVTVVMSIRNPYLCAHCASEKCPTECPHLISHCGEFAWTDEPSSGV